MPFSPDISPSPHPDTSPTPASQPLIGARILTLREQRVMLDEDLALLYGVQTKALVQAVKRNAERFPADFMFQLSPEEFDALRSQTVTSNSRRGGRRTPPYCIHRARCFHAVFGAEQFTSHRREHRDRANLRSSPHARRHARRLSKTLARDLEEAAEALSMAHDGFSRNTRAQFKQVFDTLRQLTAPPDPPKRPIGFVTHGEDRA